MSAQHTWTDVLRTRHTLRLLTWTTIGRLPEAIVPIALVLTARQAGATYAWATALGALYGLALATGQPVLGRLTDRTGQTIANLCSALTSTAAITALAWPGMTTHHLPATGLVLAAGAGFPPLEASLRALWDLLVPPTAKEAAYSLDSSSQQTAYLIAPALIGIGTLLTGPRGVLLAAAALGLAGTLGVITAPPSRTWRPTPRTGKDGPGPLGALRPPGMWLTLAILVCFGGTIGALYTAGPVLAEQLHTPWLAGALPAALSAAAMAGNAAWARWGREFALHRRLVALAALYALSWLGLLAATTPAQSLAAVTISGLIFGPLMTTCYHLIDQLAPPGTTTEAFSWLVSAVYIGIALGTRAGGSTTDHPAIPALAGAAALFVLATTVRRALPPPASTDAPAPPVHDLHPVA